ncbi:hypothetical protein [Brevundimonas vancanneytii]|jgi:hypothetical protein|nr:hypothetical protein [Brevundimonas vancanneytii]
MVALTVSLLGAFPAAAQTAQRFDLRCEGTRSEELNGPEAPYSYGFRVDLDAGKWCWAHCERIFDLKEVNPDRLVFDEKSSETRRERQSVWHDVSRTTGAHKLLSITISIVPRYYKVEGTCRPAPFSGFPTAMF